MHGSAVHGLHTGTRVHDLKRTRVDGHGRLYICSRHVLSALSIIVISVLKASSFQHHLCIG
jgi:hypothetical protein